MIAYLRPVPREAPLGDFLAAGCGARQATTIASAALFLAACFLPLGTRWIGLPALLGGAFYLWIPLFWCFLFPWLANVLFGIGLWAALHSRWRAAGDWGAGATLLAGAAPLVDPFELTSSPAYFAWLGSMFLLAVLSEREPAAPPLIHVDGRR